MQIINYDFKTFRTPFPLKLKPVLILPVLTCGREGSRKIRGPVQRFVEQGRGFEQTRQRFGPTTSTLAKRKQRIVEGSSRPKSPTRQLATRQVSIGPTTRGGPSSFGRCRTRMSK